MAAFFHGTRAQPGEPLKNAEKNRSLIYKDIDLAAFADAMCEEIDAARGRVALGEATRATVAQETTKVAVAQEKTMHAKIVKVAGWGGPFDTKNKNALS